MKRYLLVCTFLLLCVGCSVEKFRYLDVVRIERGFYAGSIGVLLDTVGTAEDKYLVKVYTLEKIDKDTKVFGYTAIVILKASDLRLIIVPSVRRYQSEITIKQ